MASINHINNNVSVVLLSRISSALFLLFLLLRVSSSSMVAPGSKPPLKIILMSGQSNMQGHGYMSVKDKEGNYRNGTLENMVQEDPEKYGMLKNNETSEWSQFSDVWIAYNRQKASVVRPEINQHGYLTAGYGGDPGQKNQMGPELGFGYTLSKGLNGDMPVDEDKKQQVLLLKIAWGGTSLAVNFRPPTSGETTGLHYEALLATTQHALSHLEELFPEYASIGAYELAGFAWHQGWNDGCDKAMVKQYEVNMANLIRDLRKDLDVPNMKVVIGVSGMDGYKPNARRDAIIAAQMATADPEKYPEFAGTVAAVETRQFKRGGIPESPGNQGYHWNNNCETLWLIGEAMGESMTSLLAGDTSGKAVATS